MHMLKEVIAPYTINPDDDSLTREPILIRRNGEPWVVLAMPYAEYQQWLSQKETPPTPEVKDTEFEHNRAAFQRLLPELLKEHRGEWVAIAGEKAVAFGESSNAVLNDVYDRLGHIRMYIELVLEHPRVYYLGSPQVGPEQKLPPIRWEDQPA